MQHAQHAMPGHNPPMDSMCLSLDRVRKLSLEHMESPRGPSATTDSAPGPFQVEEGRPPVPTVEEEKLLLRVDARVDAKVQATEKKLVKRIDAELLDAERVQALIDERCISFQFTICMCTLAA